MRNGGDVALCGPHCFYLRNGLLSLPHSSLDWRHHVGEWLRRGVRRGEIEEAHENRGPISPPLSQARGRACPWQRTPLPLGHPLTQPPSQSLSQGHQRSWDFRAVYTPSDTQLLSMRTLFCPGLIEPVCPPLTCSPAPEPVQDRISHWENLLAQDLLPIG